MSEKITPDARSLVDFNMTKENSLDTVKNITENASSSGVIATAISENTKRTHRSHSYTRLNEAGVSRRVMANRNNSKYTKKRTPLTISSSRAQKFKKKKIGFDAEQCGFIRINEIILTISGNVTKTFEQLSGNSDKNAQHLKDLPISTKQSPEIGISKKPSSIIKNKITTTDNVGEALANYLRSDETTYSKTGPLSTQLCELDEIVTQPRDNQLFPDPKQQRPSIVFQPPKKGTYWEELKKLGVRGVKQKHSLFEMIVPEATDVGVNNVKPSHHDIKENSDYDGQSEQSDVKSNISLASYASSRFGSQKSSQTFTPESTKKKSKSTKKKQVTIQERDGTVHSISQNKFVDTRENTQSLSTTLPLTVNIPPTVMKTLQNGNISRRDSSDSFKQTDKSYSIPPARRNSTPVVEYLPTPLAPISSNTSTFQSSSASPNSIISRNNNYTSNNSVKEFYQERLTILTDSFICTGNIHYSFATVGLNTDTAQLQCELWLARLQAESLRRENKYMKRDSNCLQTTSLQFPCQHAEKSVSFIPDHIWTFSMLLPFITAIFFGILIGKFVI